MCAQGENGGILLLYKKIYLYLYKNVRWKGEAFLFELIKF